MCQRRQFLRVVSVDKVGKMPGNEQESQELGIVNSIYKQITPDKTEKQRAMKDRGGVRVGHQRGGVKGRTKGEIFE